MVMTVLVTDPDGKKHTIEVDVDGNVHGHTELRDKTILMKLGTFFTLPTGSVDGYTWRRVEQPS